VESRERFELSMFCVGGIPSPAATIGRLERSRTAENALRRRESESIGEAGMERKTGIEPADASLATTLTTLAHPHWLL